jgi:hypothetical protein
MKAERYKLLKEILASGKLRVDLETGKVYGLKGERSGRPNHKGYLKIVMRFKRKSCSFKIHEIVAVAGGLDITGFTVNHKDEIKLHNWFSNLEPMTNAENIRCYHRRRYQDAKT